MSSTSGSAKNPGGRRHFIFCRIRSSCDETNKTNLKFSVFNRPDLQIPSSPRVSDSTYEGLKLRMTGEKRDNAGVSDSTYEGLKLAKLIADASTSIVSDSTYEGLKLL